MIIASLCLGPLRDSTSQVGSHSIRDHLIRRSLHMMTTYEPQDLLVEPVRDENFDVSVGLDYVANDTGAHAPRVAIRS